MNALQLKKCWYVVGLGTIWLFTYLCTHNINLATLSFSVGITLGLLVEYCIDSLDLTLNIALRNHATDLNRSGR